MTQRVSEEAVARATLTYLVEPGDALLGTLVREQGPVSALMTIRADRLPGLATIPATPLVRRVLTRWQERLAAVPSPVEIAGILASGTRLISPDDPEWPPQLADLGTGQPIALWARGTASLQAACAQSVAIVGSRANTAYGGYLARSLAAELAEQGWTVVSGAAYGIDGAAHQGALAGRGRTVAVMACGVDRPYPAGHAELLGDIASCGVIVSEYPPGSGPARLRFLARNRIIAALASSTVVVEAGRRSGSLNCARAARDLSRPVMAVPGPVTCDTSAGCHELIQAGAHLVTSAQEVIRALSTCPDSSG